MKIALVKSRLNARGGLEKYARALLSHFAAKGHEVTFLTSGDPPTLPKVISLCKNSKFSLWNLCKFNRAIALWLRKNPHEIVFGLERTLQATHLRLGMGVHRVYLKRRFQRERFFKKITLFINPLHLLTLFFEKKAIENPNLQQLICNSTMVKEEVLENFLIDEDKIKVVHNGVEWMAWERPFRESLKRPRAAPYRFLFVGNGYQRKGLPQLMEALSSISQEYHLTVVGKEKNIFFFIQLAKKLGIEKKVTFAGPQEALLPFYQEADALVIPSLYDPFANVTVEALAMGLFVVTSAYNGGKEVLQKKSGVVIKNLFCVASVKEALLTALLHRKTPESAEYIRNTIKELDFSQQLDILVTLC